MRPMKHTGGSAGFSAADAARTLRDLPDYEETLTARAFGTTIIAFALGGGATTLTYAYASDWFVAAGVPWLLSFLWVPWILFAALLTSIVWDTQRVTLRLPNGDPGSWWLFLAFSILYMALLGGVAWADHGLGLGLGVENHNLLVLGLFSAVLATFFGWRYGRSWMHTVLYVVAAVLIAAAVGYAQLDLAIVPATLLAVFTGSGTWVVAGVHIARRG